MQIAYLALSIASIAPMTQDGQLELVDRVEVIVNDEILTYRQVMGSAVRRIPDGIKPTPTQLAELHRQVGKDLIDERLKVQGGIDMGFEEEAVQRIVTSNTLRRVSSAGGVVEMADELDGSGLSLTEQESDLRRKLYSFSWERAITGVNVGVAGRTYRDRYVRPGQLKLRYELFEEGQPGAEAIQGSSAKYHLQELLFPIPQGEAEGESTKLRAEEVRRTLLEGLEFTAAVRGSSTSPENDGMLPPLTVEQLSRNGGPEAAAFAITAKVGDISRPMPILRGRNLLGWRIMKLLDTDAPLLPLFELPRTQALLQSTIQSEKDDYLRSEGLKGLNQGAYIWFTGAPQE